MATKSGTGLLLPLVLVAAGVVFWPRIQAGIGNSLDGATGGVELVGEGETRFMVAASAAGQVKKCTPRQSLAEQACDDLKFITFDAARMPFITQNISRAWREGRPGVLTKDSAAEPENRKQVCLAAFPRTYGGQCDEYPFASTPKGGKGLARWRFHLARTPAKAVRCARSTVRAVSVTATATWW
ncbi:hypothetical protein KZQ38_00760 [Saccharothrix sp. SC076]|nr:hypothetical protein [Saccharothrix obliqua]MBW4715674.1 hypothetical protein [Saccharothrix obliqua]